MTGESFTQDDVALTELVQTAIALRRPDQTTAQRCSDLARTLDARNRRSPSTNGLLAIAIDRLATIAVVSGRLATT